MRYLPLLAFLRSLSMAAVLALSPGYACAGVSQPPALASIAGQTLTPSAITQYSGTAGTGNQGGSEAFTSDVPTNAFSAISTLGTTVTVWEGQ